MTDDGRLTVRGAASLQLLLRVVNLIAQRNMMPATLEARLGSDEMVIDIVLAPPVDVRHATLIEKLRTLVEVADVR